MEWVIRKTALARDSLEPWFPRSWLPESEDKLPIVLLLEYYACDRGATGGPGLCDRARCRLSVLDADRARSSLPAARDSFGGPPSAVLALWIWPAAGGISRLVPCTAAAGLSMGAGERSEAYHKRPAACARIPRA